MIFTARRILQVLYAGSRSTGQPLVDRDQPGRVRVRLVNHPESETCIRALKATTIGASAHVLRCSQFSCVV